MDLSLTLGRDKRSLPITPPYTYFHSRLILRTRDVLLVLREGCCWPLHTRFLHNHFLNHSGLLIWSTLRAGGDGGRSPQWNRKRLFSILSVQFIFPTALGVTINVHTLQMRKLSPTGQITCSSSPRFCESFKHSSFWLGSMIFAFSLMLKLENICNWSRERQIGIEWGPKDEDDGKSSGASPEQ